MKKILSLSLSLISFINFSYSQTASAPYEIWDTKGNITRTTAIIDGVRVSNGPVNYTGKGYRENDKGVSVTMSGNLSKNKLNGPFKASRTGIFDYYDSYSRTKITGSENFAVNCNLIDDVLDGKATFICASKINENGKLWYKSYDLLYNITFDKGNVKNLEIKNQYKSERFLFVTDQNNYLSNIQYHEFKENGFPVREETYYIHGVKVWQKKFDVNTKQQLGQTEYFKDTLLVNENNYNANCNCFESKKASEYKTRLNQVQTELNKIDSLNKVLRTVYNSKNIIDNNILGAQKDLNNHANNKGKEKNYELFQKLNSLKIVTSNNEDLLNKIKKNLTALNIIQKDKKFILTQIESDVAVIVCSIVNSSTPDIFTVSNYEIVKLTEDQLKTVMEKSKITTIPFEAASKEQLQTICNLNNEYLDRMQTINKNQQSLKEIIDQINSIQNITSTENQFYKERSELSGLLNKNVFNITKETDETIYSYYKNYLTEIFDNTFLSDSKKNLNLPYVSE